MRKIATQMSTLNRGAFGRVLGLLEQTTMWLRQVERCSLHSGHFHVTVSEGSHLFDGHTVLNVPDLWKLWTLVFVCFLGFC